MPRTFKIGIENKITVGVVVLAAVIIVGQGVLGVNAERLRLETRVQAKAGDISARMALSLLGPLWDLDDEQVNAIVLSEMADPEIVNVMVYGDAPGAPPVVMKGRGANWQVVDLTRPSAASRYTAAANINKGDVFLGTIRINLSDRTLLSQLRDSVNQIIIRTIIVSGSLVVLVLILTRILVTPLRKAEAIVRTSLHEKETLLKEIHHRVKNNLQVISGLLNLQAHHITDEAGKAIYRESQNRVITMALIHEELYQSKDLSRVDFAVYINELTTNLFASYGVQGRNVVPRLELDNVEMVVDTAIPCGLILNELISNSLKHAFPDDRAGEVLVRFRDLGDEMFELKVADNGVGLSDWREIEKSDSLGLQLVTMLVEQLSGKLEVDGADGFTCKFTFKEYHEAGTALY
jgi:two-component sensor histidine kinase